MPVLKTLSLSLESPKPQGAEMADNKPTYMLISISTCKGNGSNPQRNQHLLGLNKFAQGHWLASCSNDPLLATQGSGFDYMHPLILWDR